MLVRARTALREDTAARAALEELESIAAFAGTDPMRALARFAAGVVSAAAGDPAGARRFFEDALDLYARSGAPFEAAQSRAELARALCTLGRPRAAEDEARRALESFRAINAGAEARRAETLLRSMAEVPAASKEPENPCGLSRREIEVLRLVAEGLSNQQIADRLVLNEHTIHRHVANILMKLDVPTRAAAAAYAARQRLV